MEFKLYNVFRRCGFIMVLLLSNQRFKEGMQMHAWIIFCKLHFGSIFDGYCTKSLLDLKHKSSQNCNPNFIHGIEDALRKLTNNNIQLCAKY